MSIRLPSITSWKAKQRTGSKGRLGHVVPSFSLATYTNSGTTQPTGILRVNRFRNRQTVTQSHHNNKPCTSTRVSCSHLLFHLSLRHEREVERGERRCTLGDVLPILCRNRRKLTINTTMPCTSVWILQVGNTCIP